MGPSGCGKSALLSRISGLAAPTAGQVAWNEELLRASDRGGQRLAVLFHRDTVFAWHTLEKNFQFGMECLRLPKAERDEWTTTLLGMANLEQFHAYGGAAPRLRAGHADVLIPPTMLDILRNVVPVQVDDGAPLGVGARLHADAARSDQALPMLTGPCSAAIPCQP